MRRVSRIRRSASFTTSGAERSESRRSPAGRDAARPKAILRIAGRPKYADGWTIKPDVVFEMPTDFTVPADGTLNYKHFDVATGFTKTRDPGVEVRPGDRAHVHHVIVYYRNPRPLPVRLERRIRHRRRAARHHDEPEQARFPPQRPAADPLDRPSHPLLLTLAAVATGTHNREVPPSVALKMARDLNLTFQITTRRMARRNRPHEDRPRVREEAGRARAPQLQQINGAFTIPAVTRTIASTPSHLPDDDRVDDGFRTPPSRKELRVSRGLPDGKIETILSVPVRLGWQTDYLFATPASCRRHRLEGTAYYDTSPQKRRESGPDGRRPVGRIKSGKR